MKQIALWFGAAVGFIMTTARAQVSAPLADWTTRVQARNGVELCVRPLREDDRVREIAFVNSLSEATRFMRFMTPLRFLSAHLLNQLMDVDYHARMAFVASMVRDGVEEFVGIARYAQTNEPATVELGVTVTDAWQRQGVARSLVEHLLRFAAWRGFGRVCGVVLPENHRMLALARSLGFSVRYDAAEQLMHIGREIRPSPSPSPSAGLGSTMLPASICI